MAGSIIVARGSGVALNSFGFRLVVENTRAVLIERAPHVVAQAYRPLDDESLPWISLDDLADRDFQAFLDATAQAWRDWSADHPDTAFPEWTELMAKMRADVRAESPAPEPLLPV